MTELIKFLQQIERDRFYGTVALVFRAGELELIRKEQTIKLQQREYPNDNRPR